MNDGAGILFKLKRGQATAEATDSEEVARAVASLIHAPAFRAAAAAADAIGSFTLQPSPFVAEAVEVMMRQAREQGAAAALAFEALGIMSRQMTEAVREITRPDGYFAQVVREMEEAQRLFAGNLATLSEEAREALRRACADAPLCPVDVSADGVM